MGRWPLGGPSRQDQGQANQRAGVRGRKYNQGAPQSLGNWFHRQTGLTGRISAHSRRLVRLPPLS